MPRERQHESRRLRDNGYAATRRRLVEFDCSPARMQLLKTLGSFTMERTPTTRSELEHQGPSVLKPRLIERRNVGRPIVWSCPMYLLLSKVASYGRDGRTPQEEPIQIPHECSSDIANHALVRPSAVATGSVGCVDLRSARSGSISSVLTECNMSVADCGDANGANRPCA